MAQSDSVIRFTVGVPGSGKSYSRVRWLIDYFILEESGDIYTNLPLHKEKIIDYFVQEKGYDRKTLESRINIFPADLLKRWKTIDSQGLPPVNEDFQHKSDLTTQDLQDKYAGIWNYFKDKNVNGAHIQLDEIQKFVDIKTSRKLKQIWGDWLSTIRHEGCTIEFITQREKRVPKEISEIAETRLDIIPQGGKRFRLLPILNSDYYNLVQGLTGINIKCSKEIESRANYGGKVVVEYTKSFRFDPFYFQFYDTANNEETEKKTERKKEPWELHSQIGIIFWFIKRNFLCCLLALFYAYLLFQILSFNGIKSIQKSVTTFFTGSPEDKELAEAKKLNMTIEQYKNHKIKSEIEKELYANMTEFKTKTLIEIDMLRDELANFKQKNSIISPTFPVLQNPGYVLSEAEKLQIEESKKYVLEKEKSDFSVVFISESEEFAILKNGQYVRVGEIFKKGVFKGQKITKISFTSRQVFLANDEVLTFE